MALDALASDTARQFAESLDPAERVQFDAALASLISAATPFQVNRAELPYPFQPGAFGFSSGLFWFAYRFLNAEVLYIAAAFWSPDSPKHPLHGVTL